MNVAVIEETVKNILLTIDGLKITGDGKGTIPFSINGDEFIIQIEQIEQKETPREPKERRCVHTEHCTYDYCKYADLDCPVYLAYKLPSFPKDEWGVVSQKPDDEEIQRRRDNANQMQ